jgi:hypothetical protein
MVDSKIIFLAIAFFAISGILLSNVVLADVVSPKKQTNLGVSPAKVICKENLFKIILKSSERVLCVKPSTAKKLIEQGLTKSESTLEAEKFMEVLKNKSPIGSIKKISVFGVEADSKIYRSSPPLKSYKVLFEVCANDLPIKGPEVILASQTATSYVKLAENIPANTCEINAGVVAAINPETIQLTLVNKGGVTEKITQLETKVSDLKQKLEAETSKLSARIQEKDIDKQRERISSIVQLRTELNQAKEELNRYQFTLHSTPTIKSKDIEIFKSFSGAPLEGIVVNILAANKQLSGEGFDVAFEMCAGSQTVRIPLVTVTSDMESKIVKLADRIIPNTCQVTGAKIKASSSDSIKVVGGETPQRSSIALELDKKITELTKSLQAEKLALKDLTHFSPRPADFDEQAAKISDRIIELRTAINLAKAQLYYLLNQTYQ